MPLLGSQQGHHMSLLRTLEEYPQNVTDLSSTWVREKRQSSPEPFAREGCEASVPSARQHPIRRVRGDETTAREGG
jgi:hypothetical protein